MSIASTSSDGQSEPAAPDVATLTGPIADQTLEWEGCAGNDDGPPLEGADLSNGECDVHLTRRLS